MMPLRIFYEAHCHWKKVNIEIVITNSDRLSYSISFQLLFCVYTCAHACSIPVSNILDIKTLTC